MVDERFIQLPLGIGREKIAKTVLRKTAPSPTHTSPQFRSFRKKINALIFGDVEKEEEWRTQEHQRS